MMARKRSAEFELYDDAGQVVESSATSVRPAASEDVASSSAGFIATAGPGRYRVTLHCPTPLAHKTLEVDAADEADARKQFCMRNGISDSSHPWDIQRIA